MILRIDVGYWGRKMEIESIGAAMEEIEKALRGGRVQEVLLTVKKEAETEKVSCSASR